MSSSVKWAGIRVPQVNEMWHIVLPFIKRALERGHGEYEAEDIYFAIIKGEMQLWAVYGAEISRLSAICVTEVIQFPKKKMASVVLISGEGIHDWMHLLPEVIEEWAREKGCEEIRVNGRAGWLKALAVYGYSKRYITVGKKL